MNSLFVLTYALIALGFLSLVLAEIVSWPVFLSVSVLIACSPLRHRLGLDFSRRTINAAVLAVLLILLWGVFSGQDTIRQLLYFTLALLVAKLYGPKAYRDHLQIFLISAFYLIAATIKLASLSFLLVFLLFLPLALAYLILVNFRRDALWCAAGDPPMAGEVPRETDPDNDYHLPGDVRRALGWPFLWGTLGRFLLVVSLSTVAFYLIPRFTGGLFSREQGMVELNTGFAETVELGDLGEIRSNQTPVMKVFVRGAPPASRVSLRWRGITLDEFDGTSWHVSRAMRDREKYVFARQRDFTVGQTPAPNTRERFELRPINTRTVFLRPEAHSLRMDLRFPQTFGPPDVNSLRYQPVAGNLFFSRMHQLFYIQAEKRWLADHPWQQPKEGEFTRRFPRQEEGFSRPLAYEVRSHVVAPGSEELRLDSTEDRPLIRQFYLQLPGGMEPIRQLARSIVRGSANRYDRAEAIERFLRREYLYTLTPPAGARGMSLEQFLLESKSGHCEYFSAAMAIMLRTLGIPTRVANGFLASEYNRFGDYYQVRQSDAHSWVEVFFPAHGWVPFDPTPPQTQENLPLARTLRQIFDMLQIAWVEYVVDFSFQDQQRMFRTLFSFLKPDAGGRGFSLNLRLSRSGGGPTAAVAALLLLLLGAALAVAAWKLFHRGRLTASGAPRPGRPPSRDARSVIAFYERLLKILTRKGFQRRQGQTPRELASAVSASAPELADPVRTVTEVYYAVRFGQRPLSPRLRRRLQQLLREVRQQPAR